MQHPFFNESLAQQHMQILQHEAAMEQAVGSINITAEAGERERIRALMRIFGLACFGLGLLAGSLLIRLTGLLPVVIAAGCICIFVTLPVLLQTWQLLKKHEHKDPIIQIDNRKPGQLVV